MKRMACVLFYVVNCMIGFGQTTKLSSFDSLKVMPPFIYYTMEGNIYTPDNLNKDWNTVVIYFKPDCEYCQKEAKIISDSINYFPNTQFLFVSRNDTASLKKFAVRYKLDNNPHIIMLSDSDKLYYTFTNAHYTPSIHVYDQKRNLLYFSESVMSKEQLLEQLK